MRFLGKWKHGVNDDPCDGMSIKEIEEHNGCFGKKKERGTHQTGAGHDGDDAGAHQHRRDLRIKGPIPLVCAFVCLNEVGAEIIEDVFKVVRSVAIRRDAKIPGT